jgi:Zn-finger nucleic acid-binding protein
MNCVSRIEGEEIQVELKYCERCGGLWLRRQGADGVYCASCGVRLAAMPKPEEAAPEPRRGRKARLPGTKAGREGVQGQARIEYLEGVAAMEVWA